ARRSTRRFSQCSPHPPPPPPFPTRRSSDLASYATGMKPEAIVAADWNRDGLLDLGVAASGTSTVTLWLGAANGTFVLGPTLATRSEEHTSELLSRFDLVCRLLLEKKN